MEAERLGPGAALRPCGLSSTRCLAGSSCSRPLRQQSVEGLEILKPAGLNKFQKRVLAHRRLYKDLCQVWWKMSLALVPNRAPPVVAYFLTVRRVLLGSGGRFQSEAQALPLPMRFHRKPGSSP